MKTKNIMIVGVGGQGSLLASKLLGRLLLDQGYDVKVSEVHGMSQRGGSVVTYVRFGDQVYSPIIDKGEADFIVSFELLEAARWTEYLQPGGHIVTNTQQINPMPVITGAASYPAGLAAEMAERASLWTPSTPSPWPYRPEAPRPSIWSSWAASPAASTSPRNSGWTPSRRVSPKNSWR